MSRRPANPGMRTPRREPSVNDDLAEKSLRRRQSHSGSGNASGILDHQTPSRETIADIARRVADTPAGDRSFTGSRRVSGRSGPQLADPADFDEWMRLIRQNRVKGPNAFTIHLIDYFHDMVRHNQESVSDANDVLNFQKATYTLGGCVKVYKTRIASVASDTSKLLNGIVDGDGGNGDGGAETDEDGLDDDDDAEEGSSRPRSSRNKRKKKPKSSATVVASNKLSIDINELSTTIDPLFRKMCADFDKRGAGGMLQYSLKQDTQGRLLLDAETEVDPTTARQEEIEDEPEATKASAQLSTIAEEDEEEVTAVGEDEILVDAERSGPTEVVEVKEEIRSNNEASQFVGKEVDLPHINLTYLSNLNMDDLRLCRSIDFVMQAIANPEDGAESLLKDIDKWALGSGPVDNGSSTPQDVEEQPQQAFGPEFGGEDFGDNDASDIDGFANEDNDEMDEEQDEHALDASLLSVAAPPSGNWMDSELLRNVDRQVGNWAGPEHWKVQRLRARRANEESSEPARPRPAARAALIVDFLHPTVDEEVLFTVGKTISMTDAQLDLDQDYLLPDDLGVTVKQIVSLETRPQTGPAPAFVSQRRQLLSRQSDTSRLAENADPDAREVWDQFDDGDVDMGFGADNYDGGYDANFFTAPDELNPVDQAMDVPMAHLNEIAGSAENQINYARTVKRVDVRLLKENIWRELDRPDSADSLNGVIAATMPHYSGPQQANLSPSMFFISLLHLTNEHGLRLHNNEDFSDVLIETAATT